MTISKKVQSEEIGDELLQKTEAFVYKLLQENLPKSIYFHNIKYTQQVSNAAKQLAQAAELTNAEKNQLLLAALFQGTGYINDLKKHSEHSAAYANQFLAANNVSAETISIVVEIIKNADSTSSTAFFLGRLFIDAQNSFMGQKGFLKRIRRLRKEKEETTGKKIKTLPWLKSQIKILNNHVFLTRHAEELFGNRKTKNLKKIKKYYKNSIRIIREREKTTSVSANSGARTLFKTALRNHIDLTNIADQKANIMLSINALIITIGLPAFSTYLSDTRHLLIPATIFLFTSVASMIIATLSTRPIKTDGKTDLTKLLSGKTNLFFFGNFYKMQNQEYQDAIKQIVSEREYLDTSFINDLYYLGKALGKKFHLLRICYTVFVAGVILSVVSFIGTYFLAL